MTESSDSGSTSEKLKWSKYETTSGFPAISRNRTEDPELAKLLDELERGKTVKISGVESKEAFKRAYTLREAAKRREIKVEQRYLKNEKEMYFRKK